MNRIVLVHHIVGSTNPTAIFIITNIRNYLKITGVSVEQKRFSSFEEIEVSKVKVISEVTL